MPSSVKVWSCSACPFAQRVRILLIANEIPHEVVEIPNEVLLGTQSKPKELLEKNPYGAVPAIEHDGLAMYESNQILQYLEEAFEEQGHYMLGDDPKHRAIIRMLMIDADRKITQFYPYMLNKDDKKEDELRSKLEEALQFIEDKFNKYKGPYFAGKLISLADIAYVPFFERLVTVVEKRKNVSILEKYPSLHAWYYNQMMHYEPFLKSRTLKDEEIKTFYDEYIRVK
jgi:glutathione S-transferase